MLKWITMTEIPMPGPEPYQQAPKKSDSSDCCKIGVIICVIFIIGIVIIAVVFLGSFASLFNWGGGPSYQTRSIVTYSNQDVSLFPSYYYDEFSVSSFETQTTTQPDLDFEISVVSTGSDSVTVTVHVAVYEIDKTTFDGISTWAGLDSYLVNQGDYTTTASDFINLYNYADTYVWVFWFDASSKTSTWSVNIDLTLRYNWNL